MSDTKCPKHDTGGGPCYCNKEPMSEDKLLPEYDGLIFPKRSKLTFFFYRLKKKLTWPQCSGRHSPYKHMTDEECRNSFMVGNNANKKFYCCMRKKWHFGECEDIHGQRFNQRSNTEVENNGN